VDCGFYDVEDRDQAYRECYDAGLHGYKKQWDELIEKGPRAGEMRAVYAFHMQDREARG